MTCSSDMTCPFVQTDLKVPSPRRGEQPVSRILISKSKTMVSEEIELNKALEVAGIQVVETDLGEYIVQLRGEPPSHIITPAAFDDVFAIRGDQLPYGVCQIDS